MMAERFRLGRVVPLWHDHLAALLSQRPATHAEAAE